jgi:predicted nucleotidyltransferase
VIAYLTIHGSHAYGLNGPKSDVDHRGFFHLTPEQFFGLKGGPEQEESNDGQVDFVAWEFRKFVRLAANSNPNVIETLFTDDRDVLIRGRAGVTLRLNAAKWFLSKKVETTFGGYAMGQLKKLSKNLDKWEDPGVRKDAMHCVRLIYMAQEVLETGKLTVKFTRPEQTNFMLSIRRGILKPVPVFQWAEQQLDTLKAFRQNSRLPEEPLHNEIEAFV